MNPCVQHQQLVTALHRGTSRTANLRQVHSSIAHLYGPNVWMGVTLTEQSTWGGKTTQFNFRNQRINYLNIKLQCDSRELGRASGLAAASGHRCLGLPGTPLYRVHCNHGSGAPLHAFRQQGSVDAPGAASGTIAIIIIFSRAVLGGRGCRCIGISIFSSSNIAIASAGNIREGRGWRRSRCCGLCNDGLDLCHKG